MSNLKNVLDAELQLNFPLQRGRYERLRYDEEAHYYTSLHVQQLVHGREESNCCSESSILSIFSTDRLLTVSETENYDRREEIRQH